MDSSLANFPKVRIAIEGCCHGELDTIYAALQRRTSQVREPLPDLLIICGDFQALRNEQDLKCLSVPAKYKRMGDFHKYYSGEKKAPVLTIFVGGNHEASNYMDELKYGGWVAPNIYFMGHSGVVWYKGVRISGISGIWKPFDFAKPRIEAPHYEDDSFVKSAYHVRKLDYFKQYFIREPLSISVSHDWPNEISKYGDKERLVRFKPFFAKDIATGRLGSLVNQKLLEKLRPLYWFSAHLHVLFEATVQHKAIGNNDCVKRKNSANSLAPDGEAKKIKANVDEIVISMSSDEEEEDHVEAQLTKELKTSTEIQLELPVSSGEEEDEDDTVPKYETDLSDVSNEPVSLPPESKIVDKVPKVPEVRFHELPDGNLETRFLALDKCLPKRKFMELLHIPITSSKHPSFYNDELYHDREYIAITKTLQNNLFEFYQDMHKFSAIFNLPGDLRDQVEKDINAELYKLQKLDDASFTIPKNAFCQTAPIDADSLVMYKNPQTDSFIEKFGITN